MFGEDPINSSELNEECIRDGRLESNPHILWNICSMALTQSSAIQKPPLHDHSTRLNTLSANIELIRKPQRNLHVPKALPWCNPESVVLRAKVKLLSKLRISSFYSSAQSHLNFYNSIFIFLTKHEQNISERVYHVQDTYRL